MNWRSGFGLIPVPAKILAALAFADFLFRVLRTATGKRRREP